MEFRISPQGVATHPCGRRSPGPAGAVPLVYPALVVPRAPSGSEVLSTSVLEGAVLSALVESVAGLVEVDGGEVGVPGSVLGGLVEVGGVDVGLGVVCVGSVGLVVFEVDGAEVLVGVDVPVPVGFVLVTGFDEVAAVVLTVVRPPDVLPGELGRVSTTEVDPL